MSSNRSPKLCPICCGETSGMKNMPPTCLQPHGQSERACGECWEAHLSLEVETKDPRDIECLFCFSHIDRDTLGHLARDGTLDRYDAKLENSTLRICQNRCKGKKAYQQHDVKTDGRVFTCKDCGFQTCIACDRPEHSGESCYDYRTRVVFNPKHVKDVAATKAKFKSCPECDTILVLDKGAGCIVPCKCGYRFCDQRLCKIPWVGEDSAYLGGKKAHFGGCKYRHRAKDSTDTLKKRFEYDPVKVQSVKREARENMEKIEVERALDAAVAEREVAQKEMSLESEKKGAVKRSGTMIEMEAKKRKLGD